MRYEISLRVLAYRPLRDTGGASDTAYSQDPALHFSSSRYGAIAVTQDQLNPHLLALREKLEKQVETIRTDTRKARADLADEVRRAGERIAIRPSYIVTNSGVEIFHRHFPADLEAAVGYALLLLLDPSRAYGSDLCRCKLAECGRFFLAIKPPTGRPRRDYCCAEHLEAAREKSSVDRVRAFREREKAKASRRHRTRRL